MSYFSKFPQYLTNAGDRKNIIITDFFRRIRLGNTFEEYSVFLLLYLVEDRETPEMVSNKFYNNPLYHWVILAVNNIIDPRTEWIMSDKQLYHMIFEKYDFTLTVPDTSVFSLNDEVTSSNGGTFIVTDVGATSIQLHSVNGPVNLATSDFLNNETQNTQLITIVAVTDPTEGVHHYQDSETLLIVDYDVNDPNVVPITNLQYEQDVNEKKRVVRVLDAKYLDQFVRDFENIINR